MSKIVDARGLSCPQPVILTRTALQTGDFPFEVLVDTVTAHENVNRMAAAQNLRVEIYSMENEEYKLVINQ